ncbi:hypothetical protein PHYBOEH_009520 [Phytophthora boehmeriae]|uniref:M96 mating-specific protein family n=1 Tax=Phytophthora boehmeriae TaxID=109152 RepID=A0A8T1XF38_9STRA|nr:hypothetical protein PHYBOEH_009520 [Phytophthora boehmeriae]
MKSDVAKLLNSTTDSESDISAEGGANESDRSWEDATIAKMVTPSTMVSESRTTRQLPQDKRSKARRTVGAVPYSTDLQRRKKSELKELRKEAQQLNARLVHLQLQRHNRFTTAASKGSHGWQSLAAIECEERQRAERCNRQLKLVMADMEKVHASFNRLLGRPEALQGREFVLQLEPKIERPVVSLDVSTAILADLATSLDSLRLDAGGMFTVPRDDHAVVCRSEKKLYAVSGHCVAETKTITPLACSMRDAGDILWRFICSDVDKSFHSITKKTPNAWEMTSLAKSRDGFLHIDGVTIYRRYDEDHRIVVVGTSTWVLPNGALQFEDRAWTVITPSSLHSAVVQTRYQLQVKAQSAASVQPTDFAYAQEAVLSSIGNKLRNAMQSLQSALLDEVELIPCNS